ncbi:inner membrane protein YhjD [Rhodococcus ruber]|uniref:inner membrane protein YhjD n=1 Tax=Rhodococcus ruber TaxID=1830 RepID=UPI001932D984|nr:inner membrane protein YhjD [Rhodococcus ruber]QRE82031.1 inner membrane protein YhjD [Rhodococcus ruber]
MADDSTEPSKPGFLERQRAAHPSLDHLVRAGLRYQEQKGDYYAAGITYFSVLSLIPILMLSFSVAGFVLAGRPETLEQLQTAIAQNIPGELGATVQGLVDSAIASRSAVGTVGLLTAAYAGIGWITNLRDALTAMWDHPHVKDGFVRTKVNDALTLLGLGLAIVASLALSAASRGPVMDLFVGVLRLENVPGIGVALTVTTIALAVCATWLLFTWVIARLPREPVTFRSAMRAGLLAAVAFEVFKQVGSIYLSRVTSGPAGVAFGPILGVLVFANLTARMLLFATAWAASSKENLVLAHVPPPELARITPRVEVHEGPGLRGGLALVGAGAVGGVLLSERSRAIRRAVRARFRR